ncbi:MAG TPA: branched-chain amino acid aminotransferase [Cyclobacteriaceae bacterium]|nr:branched-chain amino acid aminotransferase [Cyclobacteriaceae bacterium]
MNMTTLTPSLQIEKTKQSRIGEVDFQNLEFGKVISDHMIVSDYRDGSWEAARIVPFGDLRMSPAMLSLHYGQSVFEGMKAFQMKDGRINIFRIHRHHERLNRSLSRMCMPTISEDMFIQTLHALVDFDKAWIPKTEGSSLYLRPVVFATESRLGVKVAEEYKYIVLTTPAGTYLNKPFRLKVENTYVRTAEGGPGFAKCAGNYGGAFLPSQIARQEGFDQVLWTDHKEHKYIDEVGMMNVMFMLNGKLITPKLSTAILDGITRDSILTLAKDMGVPTEERRISVDEIAEGFESGTLTEAFGAGTAAVVATIGCMNIHGTNYDLKAPAPDSFQNRVKEKLNQIRLGLAPDIHEWNYVIG